MAPLSSCLLLLIPLLIGVLLEVGGVAVTPSHPRVSFLLNSAVRPLVHFGLPGLANTTTLLLSNDGSSLYVGARDSVLSLDVSQSDVISLKNKVRWHPSEKEIKGCSSKGKNETVDCPNFVSVLQMFNSTHLYVCGSFAFSPRDAFIDLQSFSLVEHSSAKGRCPFNPLQGNSATIVDGELFTASTTDFRGLEPQISRHFSRSSRPDVILESSITLLEEPEFVSASSDPTHRKVYFFFTEVGKEFSFVDDLRIARVAQVCQDDVGGQRTLQRKWTSFAKAPLLCRLPKRLPFNVLQDMFALRPQGGASASDTVFYGIFTSQWSGSPESAVCVFTMQDIRAAFDGSYREFDTKTHQWSPLLGTHSYLGKCGLDTASDLDLEEVKKGFLTSSGVTPASDAPVLVSSEHQYRRVAAMTTTAANGKQYQVLFLLTESGFLHKVLLLDHGPWVIEEVQVSSEAQMVKSFVLSTDKGALYVGTSEGVTAVPLVNCSAYRSCAQCVLARDPQCGWSLSGGICSPVSHAHLTVIQDVDHGNAAEKCRELSGEVVPPADVLVHLNTEVKLPCVRPSQLSRLSWTSTAFDSLPQELFMTSSDSDSLRFVAAAATMGRYSCHAEEGGHSEVVAVYHVKSTAFPRSLSRDESKPEDESFEDIATEEPTPPSILTAPPAGDTEDDGMEFTVDPRTETTTEDPDEKTEVWNETVTARRDVRLWQEKPHVTHKQKSYYGELVVVSLLLAVVCACVLMLIALAAWRYRNHGPKVNPLVAADASPELREAL